MRGRIRHTPGYTFDPAYPFLAPGTTCEIMYEYYESCQWRRINNKCYMVRFDGVEETFPMYAEEIIKER